MNPVYDTVGFGPAGGSRASRLVPYARAHELFRDLKSKVDLIFLCTKGNRLNDATRYAYHLFNDFFLDSTVPIALAVTNREEDTSMDD